jgi:hypothetical protein
MRWVDEYERSVGNVSEGKVVSNFNNIPLEK